MAEYSRVSSEGWEHGDDSSSYSRVTSEGWEHWEAAATGVVGPLIGSSHLMTNGILINGRLV